MTCRQKNAFRTFILTILAGLLLASPCAAIDEQHVVNPSDLHQAMRAESQARENNLASVRKFLTSEPAANALKNARIDPVKVEQAAAMLDNEELARLAARTAKVQEDFAAGALTNQQLTYIIIALATAVIILVIVAA